MGLRVTVGGIADPSLIDRNYEDIRRILLENRQPFKEVETKTESGSFKSFTIEA